MICSNRTCTSVCPRFEHYRQQGKYVLQDCAYVCAAVVCRRAPRGRHRQRYLQLVSTVTWNFLNRAESERVRERGCETTKRYSERRREFSHVRTPLRRIQNDSFVLARELFFELEMSVIILISGNLKLALLRYCIYLRLHCVAGPCRDM